jgi:glycosyltransferase involved in cell wall biosynthesis
MKNYKVKVLIIEHSLPFYHIPAWQLLGSHPEIDLTIAYGQGFFTGKENGVPEGEIPDDASFKFAKCNIIKKLPGKKILWHSSALSLLGKEHYDIVIHQFELKMMSLFPSLYLAKRKHTKFSLWGIGNPLMPSPVTDKLRKFVARIADAMVFYSETNMKKYIDWGIESSKLFVAKNSVDVDTMIALANNWNQESTIEFKRKQNIPGKLIVTMGRLIERKKIDWLILAVQKLISDYPDIKLVIIGNGPEYEKLLDLGKTHKISDNLIFTGKLEGFKSIAPWLLSSDLIIAPAQVGHLATEAHAYGIPLILSDNKSCQGPESEILIPDITGVLYHHGNIEHLAEQIRRFYSSPDLQLIIKSQNQKRAKEFAGTKVMVNGFIDTINYLSSKNLAHF